MTNPISMPALDPLEIDRLLETLTGVVRARVRLGPDGDSLAEIHILSDGAAPPKQIVRNVETLLQTAFDLKIDHRVVSIAVLKDEEEGPRRAAEPALEAAAPAAPRVVFQRLRVSAEEPYKCAAHVELMMGDVIFEGTHRDADTPRARLSTCGRAVIDALDYLGEKEIALSLAGMEQIELFGKEVVVALVEARYRRKHMKMFGTSAVQADPQEAAALAVLDAVNRFITRPNGLRSRG